MVSRDGRNQDPDSPNNYYLKPETSNTKRNEYITTINSKKVSIFEYFDRGQITSWSDTGTHPRELKLASNSAFINAV